MVVPLIKSYFLNLKTYGELVPVQSLDELAARDVLVVDDGRLPVKCYDVQRVTVEEGVAYVIGTLYFQDSLGGDVLSLRRPRTIARSFDERDVKGLYKVFHLYRKEYREAMRDGALRATSKSA